MAKIRNMTLDSLPNLDDARVSLAFLHELRRAVVDCLDRPGDTHARKVALEFTMRPIVDEATGQCDEVRGDFEITSKVPKRKSKTYSFGVRKNGDLVFNENSPQNVKQSTIFDGEANDDDE